MPQQLIFTSAIRGLRPGTTGYCTVSRSNGMREMLETKLEQFSTFQHQRTSPHPYIAAHRILDLRGSPYHVLSRISDAGLDHTSRTNFIAHHVVLQPFELSELPDPATILHNWTGWLTQWTGEPGPSTDVDLLPSLAALAPSAPNPGEPAQAWTAATGNPAYADLLVPAGLIPTAALVTPRGRELADLLPLISESLVRAASDNYSTTPPAWQIPFTTWLQPKDAPRDFRWFGTWGLETATAARPTLLLDFASGNLPPAPAPVVRRQSAPAAKATSSPHGGQIGPATFQQTVFPEAAVHHQQEDAQYAPQHTFPETGGQQVNRGRAPLKRNVVEESDKPKSRIDPLVMVLGALAIMGVGALIGIFIFNNPETAATTTESNPDTQTNSLAIVLDTNTDTQRTTSTIPSTNSSIAASPVLATNSPLPKETHPLPTIPAPAADIISPEQRQVISELTQRVDALLIDDLEKDKLRSSLKDDSFIAKNLTSVKEKITFEESIVSRLNSIFKDKELPQNASYLCVNTASKSDIPSITKVKLTLPIIANEPIKTLAFIKSFNGESHIKFTNFQLVKDSDILLNNDEGYNIRIINSNQIELRLEKFNDITEIICNKQYHVFTPTNDTAIIKISAAELLEVQPYKNKQLKLGLKPHFAEWLKRKDFGWKIFDPENSTYSATEFRLASKPLNEKLFPALKPIESRPDLEFPDTSATEMAIDRLTKEINSSSSSTPTPTTQKNSQQVDEEDAKEQASQISAFKDPLKLDELAKSAGEMTFTSHIQSKYQGKKLELNDVRFVTYDYLLSLSEGIKLKVANSGIPVGTTKPLEFPTLSNDYSQLDRDSPQYGENLLKRIEAYTQELDKFLKDPALEAYKSKFTGSEFAAKWLELFKEADKSGDGDKPDPKERNDKKPRAQPTYLKLKRSVKLLFAHSKFTDDSKPVVSKPQPSQSQKNELKAETEKLKRLESLNSVGAILDNYEICLVVVPKGSQMLDTRKSWPLFRLIKFTSKSSHSDL
ncbi:MAG: hypothetical protein ACAI35_19605 [Candidatus Methylacidiphilales bacterium]